MRASMILSCSGSSATQASAKSARALSGRILAPSHVAPRCMPVQQLKETRSVKAHFFKFGKKKPEAVVDEIPTRARDYYDHQELEEYFNYMGFLAEERSYDRMDAMVAAGLHCQDIILLLACKENDTPKIQELLQSGADVNVVGIDGKRPIDFARKPEVIALLQEYQRRAPAKAEAVARV